MKKLIVMFFVLVVGYSYAQDRELVLIIEKDTVSFKDELNVFLVLPNEKIQYNKGNKLIFDNKLNLSDIQEILVVFHSDSITFFSTTDFSEERKIYIDTSETALPNLIIPSFKDSYFSYDNMYFSTLRYDETKDILHYQPEAMRKAFEKQIEEDKGKTTLKLKFHMTETKRKKIKNPGNN